MLIAFSTDPGQTASDAGDGSGPYAAALAANLVKRGQHHLDLFQNVKEQVYQTTRLQVPWTRDGLLQRIYLSGREQSSSNLVAIDVPTAPLDLPSAAARAWSAIKDTRSVAVLKAYRTQYSDSLYSQFALRKIKEIEEEGLSKLSNSSPQQLARLLQTELKRVGCYSGSIDGVWGAGSRQAIADYNRFAQTNFYLRAPTKDAILAAKSKRSKICPQITLKGQPDQKIAKERERKKSKKKAQSQRNCRTYGQCLRWCNNNPLATGSVGDCGTICGNGGISSESLPFRICS